MLTVSHLYYRTNRLLLVDDVSFEVAPGEILAIIGANGAGKSTLLKMCCGALEPASGQVSILNKKLSDWKAAEIAQFVAVLHQQTILTLPFSVKDVVMMGRYPHFKSNPTKLDHTIVANAIKKAGIKDLTNRNYMDLSGGEQQRVHLARVFAQVWFAAGHDTRYLFMDEPSNNLDIRHQHNMLCMAREFVEEGACAVAVLHDLNLAMQYADKVLLMKHGKALAFGPTRQVLTTRLVSAAYDFPVHIIDHEAYDFPIVMPAANQQLLTL